MCIINEQWLLGDDNKYYRLSGQRTSRHCVDWVTFTVAQVICGLGVVLQQVETEWTNIYDCYSNVILSL